jgi:hypothetical protein
MARDWPTVLAFALRRRASCVAGALLRRAGDLRTVLSPRSPSCEDSALNSRVYCLLLLLILLRIVLLFSVSTKRGMHHGVKLASRAFLMHTLYKRLLEL